ncbi:hypothetical protein VNO78_08739 [Psophocarpus tetragonolobus]|uniref:Uncharacterized protein n=1 Tax=Psophocarpus tetragonolobus TaxID=3891 RepID=A0AAN9T6E7_PSOTE
MASVTVLYYFLIFVSLIHHFFSAYACLLTFNHSLLTLVLATNNIPKNASTEGQFFGLMFRVRGILTDDQAINHTKRNNQPIGEFLHR